jgi:hypothetical protein
MKIKLHLITLISLFLYSFKLTDLLSEVENESKILNVSFLEYNVKKELISKFPQASIDSCLLTDLQKIEEEDYDYITVFHSLEWVDNPQFYIKKLLEKLKPQGTCLLVLKPKECPFQCLIKRTLQDLQCKIDYPSANYRILDYKSMIRQEGGTIIYSNLKRKNLNLSSEKALINELEAFCLPILYFEQKDLILSTFFKNAQNFKRNNIFSIPSKTLILLITK